jgi:hypothetical protein
MPGPLVYAVLKAFAPKPLCLALVNHQIDQRCPPMDCRFTRRLRFQTLALGIRPTLPNTGPSIPPTVPTDSSLYVVYHIL